MQAASVHPTYRQVCGGCDVQAKDRLHQGRTQAEAVQPQAGTQLTFYQVSQKLKAAVTVTTTTRRQGQRQIGQLIMAMMLYAIHCMIRMVSLSSPCNCICQCQQKRCLRAVCGAKARLLMTQLCAWHAGLMCRVLLDQTASLWCGGNA